MICKGYRTNIRGEKLSLKLYLDIRNDDFFSYLAKYKVIKAPDHGVEGGDTDESDTEMIGAANEFTNLVQQ